MTRAAVATNREEARLYRLFEVGKVGADVVIAVDTSLSMKDSFPAVSLALDSFGRILQPADRLTVIVFDNDAKVVYRGPAGAEAKIKKALPGGPNPNGQRTDMGEGVAAVMKEMKGGADRLPVVVFLTDGAEDPPPQSRFSVRHDQTWAELKRAAERDPSAKRAFVHGIGLNQNTDISKLKQVWPQAAPLTVNPDDLAGYFAGLKERIRRERLRRELQKELSRGRVMIEVDGTNWGAVQGGATFKRTFSLTSSYKKLPVTLTVEGASWSDFRSLTKDRSLLRHRPRFVNRAKKLVLGPGRSRRFPVTVRTPRLKGRFGLKTEEKYRGRVRLQAAGTPKYAGAIAGMGVEPGLKFAGSSRTVWFYRSVGQSIYMLAALALAALTVAAVLWRRAVLPTGHVVYRQFFAPPLFGRLAFSGAPAGQQLPRPLSLDRFGRRTTIGTNGKVRLTGKDIKERHAEIFTGWDKGEPKVMIRQRDGMVRVAKSPGSAPVLVTGPTPLSRGSVIQIGDYRMQWI